MNVETATTGRPESFARHLLARFRLIPHETREERETRKALRELRKFENYELADIGLSRSDLTPEGLRIAGAKRDAAVEALNRPAGAIRETEA